MLEKKKNIIILLIVAVFIVIGVFIIFLNKKEVIRVESKKKLSQKSCYNTLCIDQINLVKFDNDNGANIQFDISNNGQENTKEIELEIIFNNNVSRTFTVAPLKPRGLTSISISVSNEELKYMESYSLREVNSTETNMTNE